MNSLVEMNGDDPDTDAINDNQIDTHYCSIDIGADANESEFYGY